MRLFYAIGNSSQQNLRFRFLSYRKFLDHQYVAGFSKNREAVVATESSIPFFIEIENSFDGMVLFDKDSGFPISTKEDMEVHGIGLRNIRKCAVKYGGDVDCIVKGNRFILSVMVKG